MISFRMKSSRIGTIAASALFLGLAAAMVLTGHPAVFTAAGIAMADEVNGFTFFGIGRSDEYGQRLRRQLESRLGHSAIERQNIINLEVHPKNILEKYFPVLWGLNRRLNSPIGERVEHDTVKLMFRYARNKNLPFSHVEMVFSNKSKNPLFILVMAKNDISGIKDTLKDKYGPSRIIRWDGDTGTTDAWEREGEVLLFSVYPNRIGNLQYRIAIYYMENIEELLKQEESERGSRSVGGDAF